MLAVMEESGAATMRLRGAPRFQAERPFAANNLAVFWQHWSNLPVAAWPRQKRHN